MSDNFDPIGGIFADIATAVVRLLLSIIVGPLNAILNPILGGTDENPVINLYD